MALEAFSKVVEVCVMGAREMSLELSERCTNSSNALFFNVTYEDDDLEEAVNFTPFSMKAEHCIVNYLVALIVFCSFVFCVTDAFYRTGFYTRA